MEERQSTTVASSQWGSVNATATPTGEFIWRCNHTIKGEVCNGYVGRGTLNSIGSEPFRLRCSKCGRENRISPPAEK